MSNLTVEKFRRWCVSFLRKTSDKPIYLSGYGQRHPMSIVIDFYCSETHYRYHFMYANEHNAIDKVRGDERTKITFDELFQALPTVNRIDYDIPPGIYKSIKKSFPFTFADFNFDSLPDGIDGLLHDQNDKIMELLVIINAINDRFDAVAC